MKCPNENTDMRPVQLQSYVGQSFTVDQCPTCGGVWFDRFELYKAKDGEATKVDVIDIDALRTPSEIENPVLCCPRDATALIRFNDRYFPQGIIVERCPKCDGFWLNRGKFTEYQNARRGLKGPKEIVIENTSDGDAIQAALAMHSSGIQDSPLVRAARFLSTPIDRTTLRPDESTQGTASPESVSLALNVLMTLLRLIILR